jgi:hypothetical protein
VGPLHARGSSDDRKIDAIRAFPLHLSMKVTAAIESLRGSYAGVCRCMLHAACVSIPTISNIIHEGQRFIV